jgi:hypothetical protein
MLDDNNQIVTDENDVPKYLCFDCCPPPRARWESPFIVWEKGNYWRCLLCNALLFATSGFQSCPSCGASGVASTAQPATITEEELEEQTGMVDDTEWLDKE